MKKGSALLIVLGMLSFMVISAVAFSAFMRYSRLPSSYLRRSSSSRMLVKAALAEAIDIIDVAIAGNPHPGVGYKTIQYPRRQDGSVVSEDVNTTRNHWRNHVFTGTNYLVSAADTVSTLTLEGLAYLPPALINEARYYSRHSTAAMWHNFGYDSGRFAFCAVDVSDHFNVNRIPADIGRGSSPENRFSLAYVFEKQDHTGYTVEPKLWDEFMGNYVDIDAMKEVLTPWDTGSTAAGKNLPLVSVADLNLAIKKNGTTFMQYFPFINYLFGGADDYASAGGATAEMQRHMAFVTDGYYPTSGGSGDDDSYDLADKNYQPFTESELKANKVSLTAFTKGSGIGASKTGTALKERIAAYGMVALYDYLDEDQVPVSLALPQTERSPMICGIRQEGLDGKLAIKKTRDPDVDITSPEYPADRISKSDGNAQTATSRTIEQTVYYNIDGNKFHDVFNAGKITAVVVYPFQRGDGVDDSGSYALDGHLEFFFTREEQGFRTDNANADIMRMASDTDFTADAVKDRAVFHVPLKFGDGAGGISPSNFGKKEDESVREYTAMLRSGGGAKSNIPQFFEGKENALVKVVYEYDQVREKNPVTGLMGPWTDSGDPPRKTAASVGIWPVKNGVADSSVNDNPLKSIEDGVTYTLRAAVWLRIKNTEEAGKNTVDLVPACLLDDSAFVGNDNSSDRQSIQMTGAPSPLMMFTGGSFSLKESELETAANNGTEIPFAIAPQGVMVSDPRWNWAPEHWYTFNSVSQNTWLEEVRKNLGQGGRDTDIFMATSDANYMQSVYELAFLPRLTALKDGVGNSSICGNMTRLNNVDRKAWPQEDEEFGAAVNSELMWRTYRPYANVGGSGAERDDFEILGIVNEGGGMKLNPYSDNENILVGAFANTPRCWWVASANVNTGIPKDERTKEAPTFNEKYAWNELKGNTDAKFAWNDLQGIVSAFKAKMQAQTEINGWEAAYDELWAMDGNDADKLMGATLSDKTVDLYGVDRKFLYGYWRDCFAVKQQLFLIFVRAEPMMMGGGIVGQTPPQLGARAVALVWRNPYSGSKPYAVSGGGGSSVSESAPHQTRVLFYRQFD